MSPPPELLRARLGAWGHDDAQPLVLALSAGADSMALLASAAAGPWPLYTVHLDHALRPGSAHEAAWVARRVAAVGRSRAAPIVHLQRRYAIARLARVRGWGLEEAGRRARYDLLVRTARLRGAPLVLVAHHADDQAETVLANLLRGAYGPGAAAMPQRRALAPGVTLARPFLALPRAQLRSWLASTGGSWIEDPSNRDQRFTRNRIRHRVLPQLEAGVPGFTAELARRASAQQPHEAAARAAAARRVAAW
ncbi:MAG: tRNA lysidine(34) synthetase TilS, partial [Planctomycetota bacterium]